MRLLLPIALICVMGAHAQRGGMGGGGFRGGMGGGGFRGGIGGPGFRGGMPSPGIGRGFQGGVPRGFTAPSFRGFGFNRGVGGFGRSLGLGIGWGWSGGLGWGLGWGIGSYGCPYSYPCSSYVTYPYVGGYWPGYSDAPMVNYGYGYGSTQSPVTVVYPPQPVAVERANPVIREYDESGNEIRPPSASNSSPIYLFAFQDGVIRAASSYRIEGQTLRYVNLENEEKQTPLDTLDRALTLQLNRERRVRVQLP
jgi:hypothetical protein